MNNLHPVQLQQLAKNWLLEDTSIYFEGFAVEEQKRELDIIMKSPGVLAGIPFVDAVFSRLGANAVWYNSDGDKITSATKIAKVTGSANKLLSAESVVLSVLSRASGIATITSELCEFIKYTGWHGTLVSPDKTTPGFRMVEEYGLDIGGAMHRYDLPNTVMLKYNLLPVVGSIEEAVEKFREVTGISQEIKVECRTFQEGREAGQAGCNIVMCDNIESQELLQQALNLKFQYPDMMIEVSGRITENNVQDYLCPWIDIISSTYLVESYPIIDFSMKFQPPITINLEEWRKTIETFAEIS